MEPALFLDRDGVITVEKGYITDPDDLEFIDGSANAIMRFNDLGIRVFIVTNQSAIARGLMTLKRYCEIEERLAQMLLKEGAYVTKTYLSPYHKDGIIPEYAIDHSTRKPNPGMLLQAADEYKIDLRKSWMVGDNVTDLDTAINAKLKGFTLVESGLGKRFIEDIKKKYVDGRQSLFVSSSPLFIYAANEIEHELR